MVAEQQDSAFRSLVGSGALEGGLHLPDRNPGGIVINRIDLFAVLESSLHVLHARQPFQGRFADVISTDEEDRFGKRDLFPLKGGIEGQPQETQKNKDQQF
jgi:hypothetical protein